MDVCLFFILNSVSTHHFLHQVLDDKTLLICSDIRHPQPAVLQFIMNYKCVAFEETMSTRSLIK